jgi:hypothetical protein
MTVSCAEDVLKLKFLAIYPVMGQYLRILLLVEGSGCWIANILGFVAECWDMGVML